MFLPVQFCDFIWKFFGIYLCNLAFLRLETDVPDATEVDPEQEQVFNKQGKHPP